MQLHVAVLLLGAVCEGLPMTNSTGGEQDASRSVTVTGDGQLEEPDGVEEPTLAPMADDVPALEPTAAPADDALLVMSLLETGAETRLPLKEAAGEGEEKQPDGEAEGAQPDGVEDDVEVEEEAPPPPEPAEAPVGGKAVPVMSLLETRDLSADLQELLRRNELLEAGHRARAATVEELRRRLAELQGLDVTTEDALVVSSLDESLAVKCSKWRNYTEGFVGHYQVSTCTTCSPPPRGWNTRPCQGTKKRPGTGGLHEDFNGKDCTTQEGDVVGMPAGCACTMRRQSGNHRDGFKYTHACIRSETKKEYKACCKGYTQCATKTIAQGGEANGGKPCP